ncbi:Putative ribonuclease H protein At1g65750 [Linum perenne]
MRLSGRGEDRLIWKHTKSGTYSVKTAYRMIMDSMVPTLQVQEEGEWSRLWKLKLPPKMKHAMWRAMRGVLPTKDMLQRRRVAVPWECGICGGNPENTWHLFVDCEYARDCWKEAGYEAEIEEYREGSESFWEWATAVLKGREEAVDGSQFKPAQYEDISSRLQVADPPNSAKDGDLIVRLPGQPRVLFTQYQGYVNVDPLNDRNMYYSKQGRIATCPLTTLQNN